MFKFALIVGHHKNAVGAGFSDLDISEYFYNKKIGKKVAELAVNLPGVFFKLFFRPYANYFESMKELSKKLKGFDLSMELHCNGSRSNPNANGREIIHYPGTREVNRIFGWIFLDSVGEVFDNYDRGLKSGVPYGRGWGFLKIPGTGCLIIEPEFIHNLQGANLLQSVQNKYAEAIIEAILSCKEVFENEYFHKSRSMDSETRVF